MGRARDLLAPYIEDTQIIREHPLDWGMIGPAGSTNWKNFSRPGASQGIIPRVQRLVPEYNPATKWARSQAVEMLVGDRLHPPDTASRTETEASKDWRCETPRPRRSLVNSNCTRGF